MTTLITFGGNYVFTKCIKSVAFAVVYPSKNNGSYEVGEAVERLEFSLERVS